MSTTTQEPEIIYPDGFDERWEWEMTAKGYLENVGVRFENRARFQVCFYDPTRLSQDLHSLTESGEPFLAEPGLIVVPEVTKDSIRRGVLGAVASSFFDSLIPVEESAQVRSVEATRSSIPLRKLSG